MRRSFLPLLTLLATLLAGLGAGGWGCLCAFQERAAAHGCCPGEGPLAGSPSQDEASTDDAHDCCHLAAAPDPGAAPALTLAPAGPAVMALFVESAYEADLRPTAPLRPWRDSPPPLPAAGPRGPPHPPPIPAYIQHRQLLL